MQGEILRFQNISLCCGKGGALDEWIVAWAGQRGFFRYSG